MRILSFLLAYFAVFSLCAQNKDALYPFPDATGKWGYVDKEKNVKIAYQFLGASPFYEDRAIVARAGKEADKPLFSMIDKQGKRIFDFDFGYPPLELCQLTYYKYSDGLFYHMTFDADGGKTTHSYLDKEGKTVLTIPSTSSIAHSFSEGLAYTHFSDSLWAYIDKTGKKVLEGVGGYMPMEMNFSDGWAVGKTIKEDGRIVMHYFDKKGNKHPFLQKYEGKTEELGEIKQGYALIAVKNPDDTALFPLTLILQPDGSFKNIDVTLHPSSPVTYITGYHFADGLAYIRYQPKQNKEYEEVYGYLNTAGKIAFDLPALLRPAKPHGQIHTSAFGNPFHEGLACWRIETDQTFKIVYINTAGKIVLDSPTFKKLSTP